MCHSISICAMDNVGNFNPHRCNICFRESPTKIPPKLTPCAGCQLVMYCSEEHKKSDESLHKQFCLAVQKLVAAKNTNHILRCAETILRSSFQSQPKAITHHLSLCQLMVSQILGRPLYHHERKSLMFPAVCAICMEYRPEKLTFCEECHQVAYCGEEHRNADRKKHSKWCAGLRLNYFIDNVLADGSENACRDVAIFTEETFKKPFPKDIYSLANMVGGYNIRNPANTVSCMELTEEIEAVKLAGLYSFVGTVLHVLRVTDLMEELNKDLNVFVLGAEQEGLLFNPIIAIAFFYCLPKLRRLRVYLFGPEVTDDNGYLVPFDCDRVLELNKYRYLYHEVPNTIRLPQPHVVIAFNSGFHELAGLPEDTWQPTLNKLFELPNVPIAFTSYTHNEAIDDSNVVQLYAQLVQKLHCLQFIERNAFNPFYDPKPLRNPDLKDDEMLYYLNQYISIVVMRNS
uniref:MYND-type domain-containing protein n=1 Tax=Anopheles farauti TaxID=69004 RepID=A0A182QX30_9DIPT